MEKIRTEEQKRTANTCFKITRATENDKKYIEGYFVVFNEKTELAERCYEMVMPEAFDDTMSNDIRALWNHNTQYVLGRTTSGTLTIEADNKGVYGKIELPDTSYANDLHELVKRGDVNQCSFGFNILDEDYEQLADGSGLFKIKKVDLHEVSVVTFPAYENTSVVAREKQRKESFERKKRELKNRLSQRKRGLQNENL